MVKIADFGSCRGIHSKAPYTEYIATRWYRSPECLLCKGLYNYKLDIWGAGCVLYEVITKHPLFPGKNEMDQLQKIHNIMGSPTQKQLKKIGGYIFHSPQTHNFTFDLLIAFLGGKLYLALWAFVSTIISHIKMAQVLLV